MSGLIGLYNNQIKRGISNDMYHAHPAISSSDCKKLIKSIEHYVSSKELKNDDSSDPMEFGEMLHTLILEPNEFMSRYLVSDIGNKTTKHGKEEFKNLTSIAQGRKIISSEDMGRAFMMRCNIFRHDLARMLLREGEAELSCFWKDQETGVACKVKADFVNLDKKYMLDLKTTSSSADDKGFTRDKNKWSYDVSAAFYCDGFKSLTGNEFDFFFIVSESSPPYSCAVHRVGPITMDEGRMNYRYGIEQYCNYCETNKSLMYNDNFMYQMA